LLTLLQESLRGLLHISLDTGHPLVVSNSNSTALTTSIPAAAVSLRLTNGIVVDTSIGYTAPGKYQLSIAEQCYRFIDSEVKYGDHEVDVLLRYVNVHA
jgi:DNA-binding sugar fermentation-stimulating protein